jgi:hypothetical protein
VSILVLAASLREANAYGKSRGIRRVRWAATPSLVSGGIDEIVELPSWRTYRSRFGIEAAVKTYLRRRPETPRRLDEEWDYRAYLASVAPSTVDTPKTSERDALVEQANRAVEALAADLGVDVRDLLTQALSGTGEVAPKKRAYKKRTPKPPVVSPPLEF